jgi:hypothetical protein
VSGSVTVSGTVVASSFVVAASDRRLKTNIMPINNALDKVSKLNGVYFDWVQNESSGKIMDKRRHVGVIAQEVERVLPEVVHSNTDHLGVDYGSMIALIIEAIHELEEMTNYANELSKSDADQMMAELKDLIDSLESRVLDMEIDTDSFEERLQKIESRFSS